MVIEAYWGFRCPECGFGSAEHGHLLSEHELYCVVCLEEGGRQIRLHRWEEAEGDDPAA